jgi:hypothetical protein
VSSEGIIIVMACNFSSYFIKQVQSEMRVLRTFIRNDRTTTRGAGTWTNQKILSIRRL